MEGFLIILVFITLIIFFILLLSLSSKINSLTKDINNLGKYYVKQTKFLKKELQDIKSSVTTHKIDPFTTDFKKEETNKPAIKTKPDIIPRQVIPVPNIANVEETKDETQPEEVQPIEKEEKVKELNIEIPEIVEEKELSTIQAVVNELPKEEPVTEEILDKVQQKTSTNLATASTRNTTPKVRKKANTPEKTFSEKYPDLEKFIGVNLLPKIGILIFVIGMGFLVKLGIDSGVVTEGMRIAIGILCAGGLIGLAHYLRTSFRTFSSILIGGALAILYFTIGLAFHDYAILSQEASFLIMIAITSFGVFLSIAYDRKELAILALLGGFGTPFFVNTGEGNVLPLFIYILILDIGMLILVYFKKWNVINYICYGFTFILFSGAFHQKFVGSEETLWTTFFLFATLFYLVFFLMSIVHNVKNQTKFKSLEIGFMLFNSIVYFVFGLLMFNGVKEGLYNGTFTVIVALFHFGFTYILFKRNQIDKNLLYVLLGLVLTFVSLIAPIQLKGNYITVFWAFEAVLLFWLSLKSNIKLIKIASFFVNILMVLSLTIGWYHGYYLEKNSSIVLGIFLNKYFLTTSLTIVSLVTTAYLLKQEKEFVYSDLKASWFKNLAEIVAVFLLYAGALIEINHQFDYSDVASSYQAIIIGIYNFAFITGLIFFSRLKKSETLSYIVNIIAGGAIFSYCTYYLYHIINARNLELNSSNEILSGYNWHYLLFILFTTIIVLCYQSIYKTDSFRSSFGKTSLWVLSLLFVLITSAEIGHLAITFSWHEGASLKEVRGDVIKTVFPIVWGISSLLMMLFGMKFKLKTLRISSLILFLITLIKLFFWDLKDNTSGKIISFIFLGIILLIVSFLYQKLKFIIQDDNKEQL